ncbi:MAG: hypothetical protein SNJ63_07565 [Sphingomonadaceae bacterium]
MGIKHARDVGAKSLLHPASGLATAPKIMNDAGIAHGIAPETGGRDARDPQTGFNLVEQRHDSRTPHVDPFSSSAGAATASPSWPYDSMAIT